jgi:hypothetical protein
MSLHKLRLLDVSDKEEEAILQEVISGKVANIPVYDEVDKSGIPDIKTPEEEAKYQAILDEREQKIRNMTVSEEIPEELRKTPTEIKQEIQQKEKDIAQLDGEIEQKEKELAEVHDEVLVESPSETVLVPNEKVFCEFCDSKGGRHKANCTREK